MSSHHSGNVDFPAPCLVDEGIVVNKVDMLRLLNDLGRVRYVHEHDDRIASQGEGYVVEAFSEPHQATLVANQSLYLNVCSFDYLQLHTDLEQQVTFDLVQDNRTLRLMPISTSMGPGCLTVMAISKKRCGDHEAAPPRSMSEAGGRQSPPASCV